MKNERDFGDKWERVDDEAVDWVIRRERGLTPSEQDAFLEWLAAAPMHGERFARQGSSWLDSNLLAEWRPEHADRPNPDLLARKSSRTAWIRFLLIGSATAAAALLVFTRILVDSSEDASSSDARDVTRVSSERYAYQSLEDGSEIDLNDGAELIIDYTEEHRTVELRAGEAHFTVSSDPDRPFIVKVGSAEIRAIGTSFNVRREPDLLEVLVTEGRVAWSFQDEESDARMGDTVSAEPTSREIAAGHRSVLHFDGDVVKPPKIERVKPQEIERLLRWKPVMLQFKGIPLAQAVDELNRRNNVQIVLKDEALGSLAIVASIRSNRIDDFVRLIELALHVESKKSDDGTIHLYKKAI